MTVHNIIIMTNQASSLSMRKNNQNDNMTTREQWLLLMGKPAAHHMMIQTAQACQPLTPPCAFSTDCSSVLTFLNSQMINFDGSGSRGDENSASAFNQSEGQKRNDTETARIILLLTMRSHGLRLIKAGSNQENDEAI